MSGEKDQTDGTQDGETEAEGSGSEQELTPEDQAEAEAQAAWAEFTGNKPEGSGDDDETGDKAGTEAASADSGTDTSDKDGDPPPESAEEEDTSKAGEGEGESSADSTDGAESGEDLWANAPSELRDAFAAERARADRAEQQRDSDRGRLSALQTRHDAMLGKTPEQQDTTAGAADTSPDAGDSQTENPFETEKWKTLREEFGDIVEPMEEVLSPLVTEVGNLRAENQRLRQGMETIGEDRALSRTQSLEAEVRENHPDYDDVVRSDEFQNWMKAAPAYIQEGIKRNGRYVVDAAETSDIVKRFKSDTGFGSDGGDGDGSGSSTQAETNGAGNGANGNGEGEGGSKPAATSRRRQIQRDSASAPRSRSGEAAVQDKEPETEAEMWDWAKKQVADERNAAV